MSTSTSVLGVVRLLNTGTVLWEQVAPLVTTALKGGTEVSLDQVAERTGKSAAALASLLIAIERAESEGR